MPLFPITHMFCNFRLKYFASHLLVAVSRQNYVWYFPFISSLRGSVQKWVWICSFLFWKIKFYSMYVQDVLHSMYILYAFCNKQNVLYLSIFKKWYIVPASGPKKYLKIHKEFFLSKLLNWPNTTITLVYLHRIGNFR